MATLVVQFQLKDEPEKADQAITGLPTGARDSKVQSLQRDYLSLSAVLGQYGDQVQEQDELRKVTTKSNRDKKLAARHTEIDCKDKLWKADMEKTLRSIL